MASKKHETKTDTKHADVGVAVSTPAVLVFASPPGGAIDPNGPLSASLPQNSTIGHQTTATVTSQQILNSSVTPVTIIPAPTAANTYNLLSAVYVYLHVGSQPYTVPNICDLYYGTTINNHASAWRGGISQLLTSNTSGMFVSNAGTLVTSSSVGGNLPLSAFFNQPISLIADQAVTGGNGTLTIVANYQTLTFT
ncbi:MAG: hypothetical protein KGL39_26795 [Patescibacteria group bacterium]|nr:hypothetical protein [Patescibacteria group bacterium]